MPSWELFREQSPEYQNSVIPPGHRKRVTVEAASTMGWEAFAGLDGAMIGTNQFGASASAEKIMAKFGFTAQHVTASRFIFWASMRKPIGKHKQKRMATPLSLQLFPKKDTRSRVRGRYGNSPGTTSHHEHCRCRQWKHQLDCRLQAARLYD